MSQRASNLTCHCNPMLASSCRPPTRPLLQKPITNTPTLNPELRPCMRTCSSSCLRPACCDHWHLRQKDETARSADSVYNSDIAQLVRIQDLTVCCCRVSSGLCWGIQSTNPIRDSTGIWETEVSIRGESLLVFSHKKCPCAHDACWAAPLIERLARGCCKGFGAWSFTLMGRAKEKRVRIIQASTTDLLFMVSRIARAPNMYTRKSADLGGRVGCLPKAERVKTLFLSPLQPQNAGGGGGEGGG